jgi:uncharacterized membrane protein (UPF0182 family)
MSRRGRIVLVVVASLLLALILFGALDSVLTNRLWFDEVHYSQVYKTMMLTRLGLFAVFGVLVGGVVGGSMYLAYRTRPLLHFRSPEQQALERYRMVLQPRMGLWITLLSIVIGLFAGGSGQSQWQNWLLFTNGGSFPGKDPQFGVNIGFYIFRYPFWRYLVGVGFTTLFLAILGALVVHYLFGGVRLQGEGERITTAARAQLSIMVALFVALKAAAYVLDRRGTLLAHNGTAANTYGAGYTAVNALLPTKEILAWISVLVALAILIFANAFVRNLAWPSMALGLMALSMIALGGIYPLVVQSLQVRPNPLTKESQYIQRSIDATSAAFGLNDIKYTTYGANNQTPPDTLGDDTATVPNIRLLDPAVVADTYTQLERSRGFYDFGEKLDIDRYTASGKLQDYVLGVREIDYNSQAGQGWNWQQAHTIYTHGTGFVGAPANKTVCDGQPYFVSGFLGAQSSQSQACQSSSDQFPVTQSGIYYGEGMGSYAITGQPNGASPVEYNGPTASSTDAYVTYSGSGGVSVGSFFNRLLYAYRYKEPNFLISSVFNSNSKILYVRDPRARVEKIAPFLTIDGDPYPAVVNGRMVWILDGYTTASTYPYSQEEDLRSATSDSQVGNGVAEQADTNVNYLRNSVKATVDAYNGTVTLYAFGADPIRDAWNKAFGGKLIQPQSSIPTDLAAHFRYPEDQLKVQRDLLQRFHVQDAKTFYSGQNNWGVPPDPANEGSGLKQPPYYLLAEFPGQTEPTFQLVSAMIYNNGGSTQLNLASLISGSYAADGTPTLTVYTVPNGVNAVGPTQAQQKMQNDPNVRKDLTLFQSGSSSVVYGNLLSLPLGNGILYVEPVYIKSTQQGSYPLMKKVLLSYGDYIAYDDDVASGIADLLNQAKSGAPTTAPPTGTTTPPTTTTPPGVTPQLTAAVAEINKALADLSAAYKSGDLAKIGAAQAALQKATEDYQAALKASPITPSPSPTPVPSASTSAKSGS